MGHRLREWAKLAGKAVIAVSLLMGLVPLLFGLLLELVVLTPVRVPLPSDQQGQHEPPRRSRYPPSRVLMVT